MRILATLVFSILLMVSAVVANADDKRDLAKQFSEDVIRKEEEAFFRQQAAKEEAEAKRKAEKKRAAAEAKRKSAEENKKNRAVSSVAPKKTEMEPVKKQKDEISGNPSAEKTLNVKKTSPVKSPEVKTSVTVPETKPVKPVENKVVDKKTKILKKAVSEPIKEEKHDTDTESSSSLDDEKAALTRAAELEAAKLEKDKVSAASVIDKSVSEAETVRGADVKNDKMAEATEEVNKTVPVKKKDIQGLFFSIVAIVLVGVAGGLWLKNKKSNEEMMNMRNYHRNRNRGRYQR